MSTRCKNPHKYEQCIETFNQLTTYVRASWPLPETVVERHLGEYIRDFIDSGDPVKDA